MPTLVINDPVIVEKLCFAITFIPSNVMSVARNLPVPKHQQFLMRNFAHRLVASMLIIRVTPWYGNCLVRSERIGSTLMSGLASRFRGLR